MLVTFKFRLKDTCISELNRQARAVNVVWNYCNEAQQHVLRWDRWLSAFDLQYLTAGACKDLDINAQTIQRVCRTYVVSRRKNKKTRLRWRGTKSLGWVPFSHGVLFTGTVFIFRGKSYKPLHLRRLSPGVRICGGSFNQDSRGKWYINCPIEIDCVTQSILPPVGIDLGLNNLASMSTGKIIEAPRFRRQSNVQLAIAQRAHKIKRVRALYTRLRNRRKDFLHKESDKLTKQFGLIVVGDVNPSKLAKTRMAKSVFDAGWAGFKHMLSYKSIRNGGSLLEVSEAYSSQICSTCGGLPLSRPKGIADLGIREWTCGNCGSVHDRDVNAARNILRIGLDALAGGAEGNPGVVKHLVSLH